jgi:ferritin
MLKPETEKAFCAQLGAELYSSYLYLSMSAWFAAQDLPGFANWLLVQAKEELAHAMLFFDHIQQRGGKVTLGPVEAPPATWYSPKAVFEQVLAHEQKVTSLINKLMDSAVQEKDHASRGFLQWFVDEQVEEEDSVRAVLAKFKFADAAPGGIYILDQEMGQRVFSPPKQNQ